MHINAPQSFTPNIFHKLLCVGVSFDQHLWVSYTPEKGFCILSGTYN